MFEAFADTGNHPLNIPQIASAACLLAWLTFSAIKLLVYHWQEWSRPGRIKLPDNDGATRDVTRKAALYRQLMGYIAADLQDDGELVDEVGFWRQVRARRMMIVILAMFLFSAQIYRVIVIGEDHPSVLEVFALATETVATSCALALGGCTLLSRDVGSYGTSLQTTFGLAGFLTVHYYVIIVGEYLSSGSSRHTLRLDVLALCITAITTVVVGTSVQEPGRYRDRARVYNQAVAEKLKEIGGEPFEPNVMGSGYSIMGRFFSAYMLPVVFSIIPRDQVDLHELPVLVGDMQVETNTRNSLGRDKKSQAGEHNSVGSLLWSTIWCQWENWLLSYACLLLERALAYAPYYCLNRILAVLDGAGTKQSAWIYASLYIVTLKAMNFTSVYRMWDISLFRLHRSLRTHLIYLLFRKLLTRSVYAAPPEGDKGGQKALTKPDILNLISSDVIHLEQMTWTVAQVVELILSLAIGCVFLWSLLGVSAAWGIAVSFLAYPPAYLLSKWELRLFDKSRGASDARISAIQETVQTISMVKMSGYERYTFDRLNSLRQKEFRYQYWARIIGFISAGLYSAAPALVILISFGHYTLFAHHQLTASVAFTSIAVFGELRPALTQAPKHLADLFKQVLAIRRIHTFLRSEDVEHLESTEGEVNVADPASGALVIQGDVTWNRPTGSTETGESTIFTLRGLDLAFPRGQISLIAGKAGAGKTLLLSALLGEVKLLQGKITYALSPMLDPNQNDEDFNWDVLGSGVAYVPQTAWLQSMSIRDNVLFGLPLDPTRYKRVLHACALLPDLEVLEDSDLTEIGERGKTLSGGQKARVSLARAMYSRASVIVLDDVLSAVDASTCQHIIKHCLLSPFIPGRTIIIASHAVEALAPIAQQAFFLGDGTCLWQGTGPDLLATEHMSHLRTEEQQVEDSDAPSSPAAKNGPEQPEIVQRKQSPDKTSDFEIRVAPAKTPRQILVDEKRAHGAVEGRYWLELIRMCGGRLFLTSFILLTLGSVLGSVAERALVESWTGGTKDIQPQTWIIAYTVVSSITVVLTVGQELAGFLGGFHAMKMTCVHMLDRVLRSPMQFFVKTRAGSIVQRFSGDLEIVVDCAELVGEATMTISQALISLASITWFAGWKFALTMVLTVLLFWRPAQWYRLSSRHVRRLLSILPGQVNAHFGETAVGAPVIRAFGLQGIHARDMLRLTNMALASQLISNMIGRWSWVYTEVFDLVVLVTTLGLVLTTPGISGAKAGFVIGFAVEIANELNYFVICAREWDLKGVTLERAAEYRNLETEKIPTFVDGNEHEGQDLPVLSQPDEDWPQTGKIEVSGVHAKYASDLPDVLKDVSFEVQSGERIGIVGATGCGKSTLAKAFFSFVDVTQGSIMIDGKDLRDLPLDVARGRLGIIGQDPMLVTGSLRLNLDVESAHSDEELYAVLRRISLLNDKSAMETQQTTSGIATESSSVTAVPEDAGPKNRNVFEDLDYEVLNAGENLSAGEKQLVVLARALLQRKKVLILDEATASIDTKTDLIVTRLVHEEFEGSTVLIIAHRLRTIMPCDRVLVMDQGRIVQYDSPETLLDLGEGPFYDLCMAAGSDELDQLRALARGV